MRRIRVLLAIVFVPLLLACNIPVRPVTIPTPTLAPLNTATLMPVPTETETPLPTPTMIPPTFTPSPTAVATYTVQSGDTLSGIAKKFNVTVQYLTDINNICNPDMISVGQMLKLQGVVSKSMVPAPLSDDPHVIVVFSQQKMYVYDGGMLLSTFCVSTGVEGSPARTGTFKVITKNKFANMEDHKEVAWIVYFYRKYAFREEDWNSPLGFPSTDGSIDMRPQDARWFYHFAFEGMRVYIVNDP